MNRVGVNLAALAMALAGCGEEARISASAVLAPPLAPSMLTVTVRDRDREIEWTAAAFRVTSANATPSTPEATLGTSGPDLPVAFRLESAGAVLSAGTVTLPRRRDWRWNVTVQSATTDPKFECFGCVGSQAFPMAAAYQAPHRDSIWVVWGGNSISDPVIY